MLTFDYLVVGSRLWARNIKGKAFEINDYMIIMALVWIDLSTTIRSKARLNSLRCSRLVSVPAKSSVMPSPFCGIPETYSAERQTQCSVAPAPTYGFC